MLVSPMMLLRFCLMLCLGVALAASENVERILAEWDADTLKARQAYDASTTKAAEKATKSLEANATAATKKGDIAGATAAWKSVLAIDPDHAKAREFFTAAGNLDAVLKEVTQGTDLLGNPAAVDTSVMPSTASSTAIGASPGQEASLGRLKTGATVMVQYVEGEWNPRVAPGRDQSPDAGDAPDTFRMALVDRSTGKVVATVPARTANKPFAITIMSAVADAVLCIAPPGSPRARGTVTYKVAVIP